MMQIPDDPDELNSTRAIWALRALEAFARQTGQSLSKDGMEEIMGDLLVDLAHLADRNDLNLEQLIIEASSLYGEETDLSGTQFKLALLTSADRGRQSF